MMVSNNSGPGVKLVAANTVEKKLRRWRLKPGK
jgi:hypothetical protein